MHYHTFGVAADAAGHDTITWLPSAHPIAERDDFARALDPCTHRFGRRIVRAQEWPCEELTTICSCGANGHEDLTRPWSRYGDFAELVYSTLRSGNDEQCLHSLCHRGIPPSVLVR